VYFQSYHEAVKKEGLYEKPEELVAWYQAAGFVARDGGAKESGRGGPLISVTRMVAGDSEELFGLLRYVCCLHPCLTVCCADNVGGRPFAKWVTDNEPGVLTYALFARPKAPKELLLFVRYEDTKALKAHSNAPEHVDVV